MFPHRLVFTVLLATVIATGPVAAEDTTSVVWELRYSKDTTETRTKEATEYHPPDSEKPVTPASSSTEVVVRLEPERLAIRESETETIYDFEEKTVLRVDHGAKTLSRSSLFCDVGFRDAEFANRIMLSEVLGKAGVEDNPFDHTQLKVLFSMNRGDSGKPVEVREEDAMLTFSVGDLKITTFAPDKRLCPEALHATLRRFLVYCCNLHPDVRSRVVDDGHIPKTLRYRYQNLPSVFEVDLRLETVKPTAAAISLPSGFKPMTDGQPLQALLASVGAEAGEGSKSESDYLEEAKSFQDSNRAVDSLLTLFEMLLATGRQPVDRIREVTSRYKDDEQLQTLLTAMRVADEDPQRALDLNLSIDRDGLKKTHVLDIFQANYQTFLGNTDVALGLFIAALEVNPHIAGVYKDLGDIHYRQYDMRTAWHCWDAARDLAPGHFMLGDIQKLEQRLEAEYPDFF